MFVSPCTEVLTFVLCFQVLRPGGQFHCLEFSGVNLPVLKEIYDAYSFRVIPMLGRSVSRHQMRLQMQMEGLAASFVPSKFDKRAAEQFFFL